MEYKNIKLRPGHVMPFGATVVQGGVNFSVYSSHAASCKLALFHKNENEPYAVIPFSDEFRIGHVFAMTVLDLDCENTEYGYIFDDPNKILLDPYAKIISGRNTWGGDKKPYRSRILSDNFDWQGDRPLEIPLRDLIIYETHARGLTAHPSSKAKNPGTFAAVSEKIPYFKELGINCVEFLPIHEFDELENKRCNPVNNARLFNYWGYSTVGFFAPKASFGQVNELKTLIRDLHKNGIEVILDVVFNHTAESDENGPCLSFRGIDNKTYYMLTPEGAYQNFSGCGNALNCNNPVVRSMILDCLRYWASEYHIDGFRFDLASILTRDQDGAPLENPPLIESIEFDPVLGKCKLIAEAWDAGGLYQVGSFPSWGRWSEWNGKYRDDMRRFLRGESNFTWLAAQGMQGSAHVYDIIKRGLCASINFITCHDGFTMMDLFSYNAKMNLANGENNNDGLNENYSQDFQEPSLRKKMIKNAMSILLLSHGVPMLLAGDEFGNSQNGNNNAYCQDNEISWLNWNDLEKNRDIFDYVSKLIALRKSHECLRSPAGAYSNTKNGYPPVSCHGIEPWKAEFWGNMLGMLFCGDDDFVYIAINMHWEGGAFRLPDLPIGFKWSMYLASENGAQYNGDGIIHVAPRSVVIMNGLNL
uniref:Glycogen debranching enzyme n=1 Tax=uncultured bacterium contig00118 TaxID=1181579 RepID=A0A806JYD5_9BACT|nr:glycogen debranching enzyme [uncultured bacterium contig00118]